MLVFRENFANILNEPSLTNSEKYRYYWLETKTGRRCDYFHIVYFSHRLVSIFDAAVQLIINILALINQTTKYSPF